MPDIKLGTSTFNDVNVLQMYDVNNKLVRFYYEGLIKQPQVGVIVNKILSLDSVIINHNIQPIIEINKGD